MAHHIVFHDDIDGIISAAIYLHDQVAGDLYRLYPMAMSIKEEKFKDIIKDMPLNRDDLLIILDFIFHDRADLWVAHRNFPSGKDMSTIGTKLIFDPKASSAARLMQSLSKKEGAIDYSKSFLDTVDMISQASYKTVDQVFTDTSPLMILRAFIERKFPPEMAIARIVEMISNVNFDFSKALYQLKIDESLLSVLKQEAERTRSIMTICGSFSVITQRNTNQYPRYSEFLVNPDIKYSIRISNNANSTVYVQISFNKWRKEKNDVNIGAMLSSFKYLISAGGRFNTGGGVLHSKDIERFVDDLAMYLNKEEQMEEMEKVGVDKEVDPVEARAEAMVKTGEAVDLNDAREKAAKPKCSLPEEEMHAGTKSQQL